MRQLLFAALALLATAAGAAETEFYGQVQAIATDQQVNGRGPLALADQLSPGITTLPASGLALDTLVRAKVYNLTGVATLWQEKLEGESLSARAWLNELYVSGGLGEWQFSAGKKIVGWDVGYGFRPNDLVQQEVRRTLYDLTLIGRPLVMAEHFDANTAWSFVLVNPTKPSVQRGADEPALAARFYQREGALDAYGFARYGERTGASLGAAAAWVPTDALELHASARYIAAADTKAMDPTASGIVNTNPWADASAPHAAQALIGGTWTSVNQLSILFEAWWDGTAPSNAQWNAWNQRNAELAGLIGTPVPPRPIAANLAWQASAFGASSNFRQANLFTYWSWTHDKWQTTLDLLYTPADGGHIVTATVAWQGDRVRVGSGLRVYGGPADAVLAQLPVKRIAYVAVTWSF